MDDLVWARAERLFGWARASVACLILAFASIVAFGIASANAYEEVTLTAGFGVESADINQELTLTIAISAATIVPTGEVTVRSYDYTEFWSLELENGVATVPFAFATKGARTYVIEYRGDEEHSGAIGYAYVNVYGPEDSTTLTVTSDTPTALGENATFTFTVAGGESTLQEGWVTFSIDGEAAPWPVQIIDGVGTYVAEGGSEYELSAAEHTITAVFGGTATHRSSTAAPHKHTVIGEPGTPTSVSISATPSPVYKGNTMTVTVTVSSEAGTPSGDVKLSLGGAVVDTLTLANGVATYSTSTMPLGEFTIEAEYLGAEGFAGSSKSKIHTRKIAGKLVLDSVTPATPAAGDNPVYVVHVELEDQSVAIGYVELEVGGETVKSERLVDGKATLSVTDLPMGSGRFVYNPSDMSGYTYVTLTAPKAVKRATTLTLTTNPQKPKSGEAVTLAAAVSSDHPSKSPTGRIALYKNSVYLTETTTEQSGGPSFALEDLEAGPQAYSVEYLGDDTFAASEDDISFTVSAPLVATTTTVTSSANPSFVGDDPTFTVTVASASGVPQGKVTLHIDGEDVELTLDGTGKATHSPDDIELGTYAVSASYGGSDMHAASASSEITQNVNPVPPKNTGLTLTLSKASPAVGEIVTVTATVMADGSVPTGDVYFSVGRTDIGGGQVNGAGQVTSSSWTIVAGQNEFSARFEPSDESEYLPSWRTLTVNAVAPSATTTTVTSSDNPAVAGDDVTFSVAVTSATGTPQGAVTLHVGDTDVPLTLDGTGKATHTVSEIDAGSYEVTADYAGSDSHAKSSSAVLTQQVDEPAPEPEVTTTTVVPSANPAAGNTLLTFTVTVAGTETTPTGDVVLHLGDDTQTLTLDENGVATVQTYVATTRQVWAVYEGNDKFAGSQSTAYTQNIQTSVGLEVDAPYVHEPDESYLTARASSPNGTPTGTIVVSSHFGEWSGTLVNGEVTINLGAHERGEFDVTVTYEPDDPQFAGASTGAEIRIEPESYGPPTTQAAIEQATEVQSEAFQAIFGGFDPGESVTISITGDDSEQNVLAYAPDRIAFNSSLFAIKSAVGNKEVSPFNVWVSGRAGVVSSSGAEGWFAGGLVGADYMFSPQLVGGLALMFDHTELVDSADSDIVANGWMAIPYIKGKLTDTLSYQLQIGGGGSTTEVTPDGAKYTDSVNAMRLLFSGSLNGSFEMGDFTFSPTASVTYFQQSIAAYKDGLGNDNPGMTSGTGSFSLQPGLSRRFKLEDMTLTLGGNLQLAASLNNDDGVWTYGGLRDGAGLNLSLGLPGGATFRASAGVSGVVLGDTFSARGSVGLSAPIN